MDDYGRKLARAYRYGTRRDKVHIIRVRAASGHYPPIVAWTWWHTEIRKLPRHAKLRFIRWDCGKLHVGVRLTVKRMK